jgi:hypothetical protein
LIQLTHPKFVAPRLVQEKEKKKGREGTQTLPVQELTDSSSRSYNSDDNNTMNTAECEEKMRVENMRKARPDFGCGGKHWRAV